MLKQCWPVSFVLTFSRAKIGIFKCRWKKPRPKYHKKSVFDRIDKNKMNNSLQIDVGMRKVSASDSNINSIFSLRNFLDRNFLTSPTALLKPFNTIWIVKWSQFSYCFPIKIFSPSKFSPQLLSKHFPSGHSSKKGKDVKFFPFFLQCGQFSILAHYLTSFVLPKGKFSILKVSKHFKTLVKCLH